MFNISKMARRIFGNGRSLLTKGALMVVFVFIVVAISRFDGSSSGDSTMGDQNNGHGALNTKHERGGDEDPPNCFYDGSGIKCGPAVYVLGIQYGGLNILRKALDYHPKIDCYSTGFWSNFTDIEDITNSDMDNYIEYFINSTEKINNGTDLCICDAGPDLARPYGLNISGGIAYPPSFTTIEALINMYEFIKVLVIVRNPVQRFIREYCALESAEDFENYVNNSIADYVACENNATRDNLSCVYDGTLSPLLQAGMYNTLINLDLGGSIDPANRCIVTWDSLESDDSRNATLIEIYNFVGKGTPDPSVFASVAALFDFDENSCGNKTFSSDAKTMLADFFSVRNETLGI